MMCAQRKNKTERKTEKVRGAGLAQCSTNLGNPVRQVCLDISTKLAFTLRPADILFIS